jgi:hypothetical protein
VKFIAVGPHNTLTDIKSYIGETHLQMPVFVDTFNIMESLYGQEISMHNIYQFRIIGPQGNIVDSDTDMTREGIESALKGVKWKFKDGGYDPGLAGPIEMLEWNQYVPAVRILSGARKNKSKYGESAQKLYDAVKAEAVQWKADADKAVESDPVAAYDLYTKVATVFASDDLAKSVADPLKQLATNAAVKDELAARQIYQQFASAIPRAKVQQKSDLLQFCQNIVAKYPTTPTGKHAADLVKALSTVASAK